MATPGHPFDTKERDELRAAQRRALRFVDDWLVEAAAAGVQCDVSRIDRDIAEEILRSEAQTLIGGIDELGELERGVRARLAQRVFVDTQASVSLKRPYNWWNWPALEDPETAANADESRAIRIPLPDQDDGELLKRLLTLVALLVAADEFATDDYIDERVRQARAAKGNRT